MKIFLFLIFFILVYLIGIFNPNLYFSEKIENENIVLRHKLNDSYDFNSILEDVNSTLKKSKIYKQEYKFNIYITKNYKEYYFFAPFSNKKTYWINPITNTIYISPIKIENGKIFFIDNDKSEISSEIKKATIQSLILHNQTPLTYIMINDWKKIGYSEYEVNETPQYTNSDLCRNIEEPLYKEFENRMCVKYMLEEMNISIDEMLKGNYSYNYILEQARIKYCQK